MVRIYSGSVLTFSLLDGLRVPYLLPGINPIRAACKASSYLLCYLSGQGGYTFDKWRKTSNMTTFLQVASFILGNWESSNGTLKSTAQEPRPTSPRIAQESVITPETTDYKQATPGDDRRII